MTELRDARLHRALQAADDEPLGPPLALRTAVLKNAGEALERPVTGGVLPWWQHPQWRVPLNALLASFGVVAIVGLLMMGDEVPKTQEQIAAADRAATPAGPGAAAVPQTPPAAAPQTPTQPQPQSQSRSAPSQATQAQPTQPPGAQSPARGPLADRTEPPPPLRAPPSTARSDAVAQAPSAAQEPAPASPPAIAESRARAAPSAVAPPPPPEPAPTPRAAWEDWSEARIEVQGRAATIARARGFRLAELLYGVVNAREGNAAEEPMNTRITLSRLGITVGLLELGARSARWTPVTGASRTLQPGADALRLLEAEAQRQAN